VALGTVPTYLIEGVRLTDPERVRQALDDADDGQALALVGAAEQALDALAGDDEFWGAASDNLPDQLPLDALEDSLDEERELLANALGGDYRLADLILVELPFRQGESDTERARQVVVILQHQCREVIEEAPSRRRKWRAVRLLRRVFKAVSGGLLVAVDIVLIPDPTGIVRVASVAGGVDMIIDAIEMD
jgi:hypothetical protein